MVETLSDWFSISIITQQKGFAFACKHGHADLARFLYDEAYLPIETWALTNNIALRIACERGHVDLARWIYKRARLCPTTATEMLTHILRQSDSLEPDQLAKLHLFLHNLDDELTSGKETSPNGDD